MIERPIILTVFSDVEDPNPLPRLLEERDALIEILKEPDRKKIIEHKHLSVKDRDQLIQYIRDYRDEILIFHYAGHSEGQELAFNDGTGLIKGIAGMFENLRLRNAPLKLVFLNGCATAEQVDAFFDTGVEAVIATRAKIQDAVAKKFAESFYQSLFERENSLNQAFHDAVMTVRSETDAIPIEETPISRGPKKKRLREMMESGEELPWFLFVRKDEMLQLKVSQLLPKKSISPLALADASIQKERKAGLSAKQEQVETLKKQIETKEQEIEAMKTEIEAMENNPAFNTGIIFKNAKENLKTEEKKLRQFKDELALLTLEVEEEKEGFLHTEALKKLKNALFEINYKDQLRYFIRKVDSDETFHAFILQGNKDCANELLVHLLLIDINVHARIAINKMELDFSLKGNEAPNENNIWTKVKEHFRVPADYNEQKTTRLILEHLERGHVIFHFKRMYNNAPQYNFKIVRQFWYTFCQYARAEETAVPFLYKCYLFASDENCHSQNQVPYVLGRGYKNLITQEEKKNHLVDILDPPIQPILFRELDEWVLDKVPRPYRLMEESKLKQILGGDYGFVLPTIHNYCKENGSDAMKIYERYFAQYEINMQG